MSQPLNRCYSVKAKANKEAEVWIYEEIGEGWFGGITSKQFAKDIQALGDVERIIVHINSPGGNVFDGNTIYNVLKQNKAKVIVNIDGLAASIASVIAMAGDEIYMADNSMMMIHNAWGLSIGYASDMREMADSLDKITGTIVRTYMKQTDLEESKIKELMDAETWMTAKEALDYGFVDEVTDALEIAAHFDMKKFGYRNAPKVEAPESEFKDRLARMNLAAQRYRVASNPK